MFYGIVTLRLCRWEFPLFLVEALLIAVRLIAWDVGVAFVGQAYLPEWRYDLLRLVCLEGESNPMVEASASKVLPALVGSFHWPPC